MPKNGWSAAVSVAVLLALTLSGCGDSAPFSANVQSISFLTETIPAADAGRLYNVVIVFESEGDAALPDRFELVAGVLPAGVTLDRDRQDENLDGLPDEDGEFTGSARLLGVPRQRGSYTFTIKAISTGELGSPLAGGAPNPGQPDLAVSQQFSVNVGEGAIAILTPTPQEGTSDPAVPAFPSVISFVNPANPDAFFSFPFLIAGGSNNNLATIYGPREWELSAFDTSVDPSDASTLRQDVDESAIPGAPANLSKYEQNFSDGGVFVLQAGQQKVQLGGFQSPRGPVRQDGPDAGEDITAADPAFMTGLLAEWFQDAGTPKNSRRDFADTLNLSGGDNTLGTALPVLFTDAFDPGFKSTTAPFAAKYPFTADQYLNAFFVPYTVGVNLTPLQYRLIVEARDTRGTPADMLDDVIARKAYIVQVQIPDITVDTILLPAGQAGVLYTAQIAISGGVPPLFADLEWVDGANDLGPTAGSTLTKTLFGIELDPRTWQFIGAPRAAAPDTVPGTPAPDGPSVELTVRAWAQVMNPQQTGPALVPTGNAGERDGLLDPDGGGPAPAKSGRHHTYQVNFALPTAPSITNAALKAGIDGQAYPGDRIVGTGGVPLLAPYPPGFFDMAPGATYPSATAQRAYEWDSTYTQDDSYNPKGVVAGLPNALTLVESAAVATNGNITGTTFDRGFLNVLFSGLDFYAGLSTAPSPTAFQTLFQKQLTLSVSPDQAVYMRGVQSAEAAGGIATGLLDSTAQMAQSLMTPILLAAGLFTVETGKTPVFHSSMPAQMDMLPVLLVNGGSDTHNRKSIPSISGYWPAESNKEPYWSYQTGNEAWKHCQQELTWVQAPNAAQSRVFMWADSTILNNFNNTTWTQRFQTLDPTKKRGVLVVSPGGDFYVPAILDGTNPAHGVLFGAEAVVSAGSTASTSSFYYYGSHPLYTRFYYYAVRDSQIERRVHMHGASTYLEPYSTSANTSSGWYMGSLGRTATSVAMSADGIWCATALAGGGTLGTTDGQKILLWRTDKQAIPAAILAQPFATALTGKQLNAAGALIDFPNSACILSVGGQTASGVVIARPPAPVPPAAQTVDASRFLLPDSLMFVRDGLLFLNEPQLGTIFGVSLIDGHLSSRDLTSGAVAVNGAGLGPAVSPAFGQYIPDNDYMRAGVAPTSFSAQFSFVGSKPSAGEEGPTHVAFVAGTNAFVGALADLTGYPRAGYAIHGSRDKRLFFLALGTSAGGGLDVAVGGAALRDLTGNSSLIYGDLLTPGRYGEELDFLSLSDDGRFAAVVREVEVGDGSTSFSYRPSFHTGLYYVPSSSTYVSWGPTNHDLMLISTDGSDMHSGSGTQHVLYMGTQGPTPVLISTADPTGLPAYAVGKNHINAYSRRVNGLTFTPDNKNLIFNYAGSNGTYSATTYGMSNGSSTGWGPLNPSQTGSFSMGMQTSIRLNFRTAADATVDFTSTANLKNNLAGLTPAPGGGLGSTAAPFGGETGVQCFWATFKSHNGNFLYFISDQINASLTFATANRNYMVGFNLTAAAINGRDPFVPFSTHAATVGFEQFDCNAWNYENRFKSVPGGVAVNGRDGAGILCVIASDASAGPGSATDLEVYVMDTDRGTNLTVLTSAVTTGTSNAINHLSMSGDGNVIAGQIAKTTAASNGSRAILNSNTDLFVVTNLHAVLTGSAPTAIIVSQAQSHGASVAFVGEGTGGGPQAIVFSSAAPGTTNATWSTRTLKSAPLVAGAVATTLDSTTSHTVALAAGRRLNDNPVTAD